ncbi:transposase [Desulfovermiculus halophilus]|jgi:REP element-mobilizing transposase RayT|uniref:transposase n=1 Tax=Desulfovermiculus halophilus TaxID=339722 RepID=UPI00047F82C1|nr:transposase [Desulfovermiculus halophilus]
MPYNPAIHNRRSIRLPGYDYSQAGAYFVTVCAHNRACLFGKITAERMNKNALGRTAANCWEEIPVHYPHAALDAFVIMPNHVHGILYIKRSVVGCEHGDGKNAVHHKPQPAGTSKTLGSIIRGFKIGVTTWARRHTELKTLWQRGFYEHIIRNDDDLNMIREYILTNPQNWTKDKLHPVFGA